MEQTVYPALNFHRPRSDKRLACPARTRRSINQSRHLRSGPGMHVQLPAAAELRSAGQASRLSLRGLCCYWGKQSSLLQFLQLRRSDLGRFTGGIFFLHLLVKFLRFRGLSIGLISGSKFQLRGYFAYGARRLVD